MHGPIIVITRNLPPLTGGMERLTLQFVGSLAKRYDVIVIGPPGCGAVLGAHVRVIECASSRAGLFLLQASWHALRCVAARVKPTMIVAASGLTAPIAWAMARLTRCRYTVVVHGLDLVVRHHLYRAIFLPAIRRADLIIANSKNTAKIAREIGVQALRIHSVKPGVQWSEALPRGDAFRQRYALEGRVVLLSVGRLAARKGIAEFIENALPAIVRAEPGVLLVVIGSEARDAIRNERSVAHDISAATQRAGLTAHVQLLGHVEDAEVEQAYAASDLFVFPLIAVHGDVEGFGMVAAEAAAQGLRSVAFDEGGVSDAFVAGLTGELVAPGDYANFAERVIAELAMRGNLSRRNACHAAARAFAWSRYDVEIAAVFARAGLSSTQDEVDPAD